MLYYLYILYIIIQDSPPFVKYYYEKAINFCKYVAAMLYIYVCVSIFLRTCVNILTCQSFDSLNDTLMRQFLDNRQSFDVSKF